jgi:long-chain acyl-CoA synthetase
MLHVDLIASIAKLLDRHAKERPEQVAYWDSSRSITYAQLARNTAAIAANLAKAGVREGDRIASRTASTGSKRASPASGLEP